jgi:polyisoprenoid-binding protein YceI
MVIGLAFGLCGPSIAFAAAAYTIDPVHSSFVFRVKHLGVSHLYGRFNESSGSFTLDPDDPAKSSVTVTIKTASIDTANEARDKHLRSPDFFNAVEFPEMTFESTSIKKGDGNTYEVTGELTILGVTKTVTSRAEFVGKGKGMRGEERAGFDGSFTIKRSDFGMNYMPEGIGDDITILWGIEGIKK